MLAPVHGSQEYWCPAFDVENCPKTENMNVIEFSCIVFIDSPSIYPESREDRRTGLCIFSLMYRLIPLQFHREDRSLPKTELGFEICKVISSWMGTQRETVFLRTDLLYKQGVHIPSELVTNKVQYIRR